MSEKHYLVFDGPELYPKDYYIQGSSPRILKKIISYLHLNEKNIESIFLCSYLYNNVFLHNALMEFSKLGIIVNVISIPLEGYDARNPMDLYDLDDDKNTTIHKQTKFSLAKQLYQRISGDINKNFNFYIFPHVYIRSENVRPFSRGHMPYSLHAKSMYMKFRDGGGTVTLTSSNMAVRDAIKDELLAIIENNSEANISADVFFNTLIKNSIRINSFDTSKNWLDYKMNISNITFSDSNIYTGPFYQNSQTFVEDRLFKIISEAKIRILVCAQHICSYNYGLNSNYSSTMTNRGYVKMPGILSEVLKKGYTGIPVKCLSQTFIDENGDSRGCRRPENTKAFSEFISEYGKSNNCLYYVNESVHSKFIIVDDIAIITTCNFTPTQFIYLDKVLIENFKNIPNISYSGIHSEVGQFLVIHDKDICNQLTNYFISICRRENTYRYMKQGKRCEKLSEM